jgi:hypothetical protein
LFCFVLFCLKAWCEECGLCGLTNNSTAGFTLKVSRNSFIPFNKLDKIVLTGVNLTPMLNLHIWGPFQIMQKGLGSLGKLRNFFYAAWKGTLENSRESFFWMLENLWAFWEFYSAKKFWADDKGRIFFNSAQKISL